MTIEDTRRLGIEFERRVQTMIPEKEFGEKLDTDTIYSYLNQYQDKYIHEIYRNLDSIPSGSKLQSHIDSVLQPLLHSATIALTDNGVQNNVTSFSDDNGIEIIDSARSIVYPLPEDFYMYVKSVSRVSSTFSFRAGSTDNVNDGKIRVLPNTLLSQNDLLKVVETPHDSLRILRYPAASLTGGYVDLADKKDNLLAKNILSELEKYENEETSRIYGTDTPYDIIAGKIRISPLGVVLDGSESYGKEYVIFKRDVVNPITDEHYEEEFDALDGFPYEPTDEEYDEFIDNDIYSVGRYLFISNGEYILPIPNDDYLAEYKNSNYIFVAGDDVYIDGVKLNSGTKNYNRSITVIYDQYTTPVGIKVTYYKEPQHFDIMTSTPCELPIDAFEELVSGAVDLYVQYVAGAEARKRQIDEQRRLAAKEQEANNARRGRNSE